MLDGSHLRRLPVNWQRKMHLEFQAKLRLCMSQQQAIVKAADHTWKTLVSGVESRDWLCQQLESHLGHFAGDFADWVLQFAHQALNHYQSLDSLFSESSSSKAMTTEGPIASGLLHEADILDGEQRGTGAIDAESSMGSAPAGSRSAAGIGGSSFGDCSSEFGAGKLGESGSSFGRRSSSRSFWPKGAEGVPPQSAGFNSSIVYQAKESTEETNMLDPLDESLETIILRKKMHRMQGRNGDPLGAKSRSTKFSPQQDEGPQEAHMLDSDAAAMVAQQGGVPQSHIESAAVPTRKPSSKVAKVPVLCSKFPDCEFGNACRYIHPSESMCKHWPKCAFGPKCAYKHPHVPCRYNKSCTNPKCNFEHSA